MTSNPQQEIQLDNILGFDYYHGTTSQRHGIQVEQKPCEIRNSDAVEQIVEATEDSGLSPTDLEHRDSLRPFISETQYEGLELDTQGVDSSDSPLNFRREYGTSARIHRLPAALTQPKTFVRPPSPKTGTESGAFKFGPALGHSGSYSRSYPVNHMQRQLNDQIFLPNRSPTNDDGDTGDSTEAGSDGIDAFRGSEDNMTAERALTQTIEAQSKKQQHKQMQTETSEEALPPATAMGPTSKGPHTSSAKFAENSHNVPSVPFPEYTVPRQRKVLSQVRENRQRKSLSLSAKMDSNSEQAKFPPSVVAAKLTATPTSLFNIAKMAGRINPLDYGTDCRLPNVQGAPKITDESSEPTTPLKSSRASFVLGNQHSMKKGNPTIPSLQELVLESNPLPSLNEIHVGEANISAIVGNCAISPKCIQELDVKGSIILSKSHPSKVSKTTKSQFVKTNVFQGKRVSGQERFHNDRETPESTNAQRDEGQRIAEQDGRESSCDGTDISNIQTESTRRPLRLEVTTVAVQLAQMCQEQSEKQKFYLETIQEREQEINMLEKGKALLLENAGNLKTSNRLLKHELQKVKQKSRKYAEHINQIVRDQTIIHDQFKRLEADAKGLRGNFTEVEKRCKAGEAVIAKYRQLFLVDGKNLYGEAAQRISDLEESLRILQRDLDTRLLELQRERGLSTHLSRRLDENFEIQKELTSFMSECQSSMTSQLAGQKSKIVDVLNIGKGNQKKIEECIKLMNVAKDSEPRSPPALEKLARLMENISASIENHERAVDERCTITRDEDIKAIENLKKQLMEIVSDQNVQIQLNERVAELHTINATLMEDIQGLDKRFAKYEAQIEKCQSDLDTCRLQLKAKTDELTEARAQAYDGSQLRSQIRELETNMVMLRNALSAAKEDAAKSAELFHLQEISAQSVLEELQNVRAKLHDAEFKVQTFESEKAVYAHAEKVDRDKLRIDMEVSFRATFKEQQLKNDREKNTLLKREADAGRELQDARTELSDARKLILEREEKTTQLEAEIQALRTYRALYTANIAKIEDRLAKVEDRYVCRDVTLQIAREELLEDLRIISELEIKTSKTALTAEEVRQNAANALQDIEQKVEERAFNAEVAELQDRLDQNETILEVASCHLRRLGVLIDGVSIREWANSVSVETPPRRVHFQSHDSLNVACNDIQSQHFLKSSELLKKTDAFAGNILDEIGDGPDYLAYSSLDGETQNPTHDQGLSQSQNNSSLATDSLSKRYMSPPNLVPQLKADGKDEIPDSQDAVGHDSTLSLRSSGRLASRVGRSHLTNATQVTRNVKMKQTETTTLTTEFSLQELERRGDLRDDSLDSAPTFQMTSSQKEIMDHVRSENENDDDNLSGMTEMSPVIDYIIQHPMESHTEVLRKQQNKKFGSKERAPILPHYSFQQLSSQRKTKTVVQDHLNARTPPSIVLDGEDSTALDKPTSVNRRRVLSPRNTPRSYHKTTPGTLKEMKSILKPTSVKPDTPHQLKDGNRNAGSSTLGCVGNEYIEENRTSTVGDLSPMRHSFASQPYNRVAIGGASSKEAATAKSRDKLMKGKADTIYPLEGRNLGSHAGPVASMMASQPERNRKRALSETWSQSERLSSKRVSFAPSRKVAPDSQS